MLRTRSYNLSNAINGHPFAPEGLFLQPSFQKESEINDPGPARLFTFLDVHERGIIDSTFGILPPGWDSPLRWWDLPATGTIGAATSLSSTGMSSTGGGPRRRYSKESARTLAALET
jgi:hypothetical protein